MPCPVSGVLASEHPVTWRPEVGNRTKRELAEALRRNQLDMTLGIKVTRDEKRRKMVEFSSDCGSVLRDEEGLNLVET